MIAWYEDWDDESKIYFIVQAQKGWTAYTRNSLLNRKVWLDGMYGMPYDSGSRDLSDFDTVLLVAEESGIFAHLLVLKSLVEGLNSKSTKTRRIVLYWKTTDYHVKVQAWLQSLIEDTDDHLSVILTFQ